MSLITLDFRCFNKSCDKGSTTGVTEFVSPSPFLVSEMTKRDEVNGTFCNEEGLHFLNGVLKARLLHGLLAMWPYVALALRNKATL
jgi:hypothetical protein